MKTVLGLDLGTNSIGWALVEHDSDNRQGRIIDLGSRIIPMAQDALSDFDKGQTKSQTAERSRLRSVRRLRERQLLRRERLHRVLNILGFLPAHYQTQIDFSKKLGQFLPETEPKLAYRQNVESNKPEFIFMQSFAEMLEEFGKTHPNLISEGKKIPHAWALYYLRKKALSKPIEKEELAWILLNFNQKRGYNQVRGEDDTDDNSNKLIEYHALKVIDVIPDAEKNTRGETWYNVHLENGWLYRRSSRQPLNWVGKIREFVVTTHLNDDGGVKIKKDGSEDRSFKAPDEKDWTLVKTKTEQFIEKSGKTVGTYIYDTLLANPEQKIKGKLVRVVERKFYKDEMTAILNAQKEFHPELKDAKLYNACLQELYANNEAHRNGILKKDFTHLFVNDILFYQRPLKSKKSLISNCKFEVRTYVKDGSKEIEPLKCLPKSHPLYQELRLWQFIDNLKIRQKEKRVDGKLQIDVNVTNEFLPNDEERVKLFDWLYERKEVDEKALLAYFGKKGGQYSWNYLDKAHPANETHAQIITRLKKAGIAVDFLSKEKEELLWHILYSVKNGNEIEKALGTFALKNNLPLTFVDVFKTFPAFKNEYGAYSAKAIKKLLPLMRKGKYWDAESIDAKTRNRIENILTGEYDETIKNQVRDKAFHLNSMSDFKGLPIWLAEYVVYNRHAESSDTKKWHTPTDIEFLDLHSLRNPIVEQVINETLKVVRDIWQDYGNSKEGFFDEIHIELGREMKNNNDERRSITENNLKNENTNLRIKALLVELKNGGDVDDVRPYSPMQQEILKIYEEGVLNATDEIPEDILNITKQAQPTATELLRYKLWLGQKYISPYTGEIIPLSKLFTRAYDIDHIIPQSRFFDDSLSNKVICETEVNADKGKMTAYEYIKNNENKSITLHNGRKVNLFTLAKFEEFVSNNYYKLKGKKRRLLMEEIPEAFIERQINDTRYITKVIKTLMSNIVRDTNEEEVTSRKVIICTGGITTKLKQDWGLNDIWNEIITPRFEALNAKTNSSNFGDINSNTNKFLPSVPVNIQFKGFNKKRIDHRHHAMDAVVVACASRNHVNYLNNQHALEKRKTQDEKSKSRYDLREKLCEKKPNTDRSDNYKWIFHKPWDSFTQEVKEKLHVTVASFKQNMRIISRAKNKYAKWQHDSNGKLQKGLVKQSMGEHWAIRKSLHQDTVSGLVKLRFKKIVSLSVALDNWKMIVDKELKQKVKELVQHQYDTKMLVKYFKDRGNKLQNTDVSKVEVYYFNEENVATRVHVNDKFSSSYIRSVTDESIQRILLNHLEKYDEYNKEGKKIEHPELAFSPDGLEEMNKNIEALNGGKPHKPIFKVRCFEKQGNKFRVGNTGNKKDKYVEAAKGTNLFYSIYQNESGKRKYNSVPLHKVIERLKQGAQPVEEINEAGDKLLFHLSPNDLVYVPSPDELESAANIDFSTLNKEQAARVYKVVSFYNERLYAIPNTIATSIVDKVEFTQLNKLESTPDKISIKDACIKLKQNRLGKLRVAH